MKFKIDPFSASGISPDDDTKKSHTGVVSAGVQSVRAGTNVTVDNSDPRNPVVSSTGGGGGGAVDSVNGQTGVVVIDADDIDDSATTNKFATASELADIASNTASRHDAMTVTDSSEIDFTLTGQDLTASLKAGSIDETKLDTSVNASLDLADSSTQPGDNVSTLTNDAGYVTSSGYAPGGTDVALADGGTGNSLADPNADRILFWDDSGGVMTWLTASTGLTISGTNITVRSSSTTQTGIIETATTAETTTGTDTTRAVTPAGVKAVADTKANVSHTHTALDVTDFDTEVSNNTDVAANTAARHAAVTVTDSSEIDFTLTGQDITASLKTGSIDETKLDTSTNASLDLADSATQPGDNISTLTNDSGYLSTVTAADIDAEASADGYVLTSDGAGNAAWEAVAGSGTVTSVAQTVPTGFTVSGSPITSSGTLAVSYDTGYQGYTTTEANKLSNIEANADVTDTANVTAAGALMDSEVTDLAGIKALDTSTLVVGPASATDNAITRYDGATGKLIQDSKASIDDNAKLTIGRGSPDNGSIEIVNSGGTSTTLSVSSPSGQLSIDKSISITGDISVSGDVDGVDLANVVQGPASATDNAIARFDSTTGKLVQNSTVLLGDSAGGETALTTSSDSLNINPSGGLFLNTTSTDGILINATGSPAAIGLNATTQVSITNDNLLTNTINERTASSGVTIDGVLIKDTNISTVGDVKGNSLTVTGTVAGTTSMQSAGGGNLTLPSATDTLVGRATTDTLTNKTLTTPTIGSFTNATHNHQNAAGGGALSTAALTSGTLGVARGGTGAATHTSGNVLVGAGTSAVTSTKAAPSGAFVGTTDSQTLTNKNLADSTNTFPDGMVMQFVSTSTGATATGTTTIPNDDTIPQNTEGTEFMTLSITPKATTNKLKIEVTAVLSHTAAGNVFGALFQDTTANALNATSLRITAGNEVGTAVLTHIMTAGTTSATTFKFRAGSESAGTLTINGRNIGRILGGVSGSSITITEYKAS